MKVTRTRTHHLAALPAAIALAVGLSGSAAQAVQVQDLVRLKGSETSKLVGFGLVVGLRGTGDGGKFVPAVRALMALMRQLSDDRVTTAELTDSKNIALVSLSATLPAAGVWEGDLVDVHVSAIGSSKSLEGGRLFLIPLSGPLPGAPVYAFAEGPITIEDPNHPTVGVVPNGAQLTRSVIATNLDKFGRVTLVLKDAVATWPTASNLANLINGVMSPEGPGIARAVNRKTVVVEVPTYERADPAAFISQIVQSYVDPSQIGTGARVVINERSGTIIVTGDVQISPVIISHKGLTITTITPRQAPTPQAPQRVDSRFFAMDPEARGGTKLADLLEAFNQLKVEAADRIAIIKEIDRSGKLHAQLIVNGN